MSDQKENFTSELYQDAVDNIRFLKQQQWSITNHGLLIFAALFAVDKYGIGFPDCILIVAATLTAGAGISFLCSFHVGMMGNRKRLEGIRDRVFDTRSQDMWNLYKKKNHATWKNGAPFTGFLSVVLIFGFVIVCCLICRT